MSTTPTRHRLPAIRSYAAISRWQTEPVAVEYDAAEAKVGIFQGSVYLAYSLEDWRALVAAVDAVLPAAQHAEATR